MVDSTRVAVVNLDQLEEVDLAVEGILVDQVLDQVEEVNQVVLTVVEDLVDSYDPVEVEALVE